MKNILRPLCLVVALSSSSLFAQENPNSLAGGEASSSEVRHVGGRFIPCPVPAYDAGPCAIGNKENPVNALEYTAFLNTMSFKDCNWFGSDYYESCFMATDQDWMSSSNATIQRKGNSSHYQYTVMPGHETDIIDSVSLANVRYEFNKWRQNPTTRKICDYINDRSEGRLEEAEALKAPYLDTMDLWGSMSTDFHDQLQSQVYDEQDRPLLYLSQEDKNAPIRAEVLEGMEYYRPIHLSWKPL